MSVVTFTLSYTGTIAFLYRAVEGRANDVQWGRCYKGMMEVRASKPCQLPHESARQMMREAMQGPRVGQSKL